MEWGPEIVVNGVRPAWLRDDDWDKVVAILDDSREQYPDSDRMKDVGHWVWTSIKALRLPADSVIYTALEAGFVPYVGGGRPDDWDGSPVLWDSGSTDKDDTPTSEDDFSWTITNGPNIIGYKRKVEVVDDADYVRVKRMTEVELHNFAKPFHNEYGHDILRMFRAMGITPTPPTRAETIAAKTGLSVADVEKVLAEVGS